MSIRTTTTFCRKKKSTLVPVFLVLNTQKSLKGKRKKRLVNRRWTLLKKERKKNHDLKLKKFANLKSTHVINVYYLCKRAFVWCCNMIIGYEIKKKLKKKKIHMCIDLPDLFSSWFERIWALRILSHLLLQWKFRPGKADDHCILKEIEKKNLIHSCALSTYFLLRSARK